MHTTHDKPDKRGALVTMYAMMLDCDLDTGAGTAG